MCRQCHEGLSNEIVVQQLKEADEFELWNTTSVSHVTLAALGLNGPEARKLAIDILERFIEWRRTQPENYVPKTGLEPMTSVVELNKSLHYIKNNEPDYNDDDLILKKYDDAMKKQYGVLFMHAALIGVVIYCTFT